MKNRTARTSVYMLSTLALMSACRNPSEEAKVEQPNAAAPAAQPAPPALSAEIPDAVLAGFKPALPKEFTSPENPITEEKITLGRMLYYDTRLSKNHDLSCNSCHLLDKFGVDSLKTSPGHKKQLGTRNSPTVYNAAGNFVQFWDGRSPTVEHQATQPVTNPVEMAMPDVDYPKKVLASIPKYVELFKAAFPDDKDPVSLDNAGKAMGAFERRLVTPAPWDKFLDGDKSALTDEQKKGFNAFLSNGCTACHMGTLVGGQMYQKVGVVKPWPNQADQGRFEVTKQEQDKMMFKAPSLRNVAETAPYFHDGSVASLKDAVKAMGEYQLGRQVTDQDADLIVAWLKSLTGQLPTDYIQKPELPASTPATPKPDPT